MTDTTLVIIPGGGVFTPLMQRIEDDRKNSLPESSSWEDVTTYRRYDRGRHNQTLSAEQTRMLRGIFGHTFADNVVHKIVFEHANRVTLLGWDVDDKGVKDSLEEFWTKNALPDLSADANYATIRDGNHAVGLRWHDAQQRVLINRERFWDGKSGVFFHYGSDGLLEYAVKEWSESGFLRRTVYWDDRIERYINRSGTWETFLLPTDDQWPMPWVKRNGDPLHIPLVHLAAISDDDTPYGASIMAGGILGLQDDINDIQRDITIAARMTAYQMYYATGVTARVGDDGDPIPTEVGPGMFLENENPAARYGVLAAGDMGSLISAHDIKLQTIAYNSATPLHLITGGNWPSGEALLRSELPLIQQSTRTVDSLTPPWSTIPHRATEIHNVFSSDNPLNEDALITARFAPTDKKDDMALTEIESKKVDVLMKLKNLGFSDEYIMAKYGLTPQEITKVQAQRLKEITTATEAALLAGE
jgi:hypothetical protein